MKHRLPTQQLGLSLLGMLFIGIVLAAIGLVGAQVVPTVFEYVAIDKAVNKAKAGTTVLEVRAIFDKAASVDFITSITSNDLEIAKDSDQVVVAYAYQREIHLFGPAWLLLKYSGRSK